MKKVLIGVLAATLVAGMSVVVFANGDGTGILGSPHDFSSSTWNNRQEICRVCHVPHDHGRASQRYLNGLLWNHGVSSASYTMYNKTWSNTLNGTQSAEPDGTSKLCLSCHDGTVGIDTFDKYAGGTVYATGDAKIVNFMDGENIDLRGTHPLSIAFPVGEDRYSDNFNDPASKTWTSGDTVASTLDNGKVQCSTCHDVHNQESVGDTHLLRAGQTAATGTASGLCLTCHIK